MVPFYFQCTLIRYIIQQQTLITHFDRRQPCLVVLLLHFVFIISNCSCRIFIHGIFNMYSMYLISIWYSSVIDAMFDCCYTFNFSVKSISIVFGCVEVSHHIIPITPIINCLWFGCYYVIMH